MVEEVKSYSGPGEEQLEKLRKFVASHGQDLRVVEQALDETATEFWDPHSDVVGINHEPAEQCRIHELIDTDNKSMAKVLAVFAALSEEFSTLVEIGQRDFFGPLSCFGERFDDNQLPEGEEMEQVAAALPLFERLSFFASRCHTVVGNTLSQLAGLYTGGKDSAYEKSFKGVHMYYLLMRMADVIRVLVTLDALVASNAALQEQWYEYKQVLQSAALEPESFGMRQARIAKLLMAVTSLEAYIFNGAFLRGCWLQELPWHHPKGVSEVRANTVFMTEVSTTVRALITQLSLHIGDATESTHRLQIVGLVGLVVTLSQVNRGREFDSKLYKAAVQVCAKVPVVALFGRSALVLAEFVQDNVPVAISKAQVDSKVRERLRGLVSANDDSLTSQVHWLNLEISAWMVRMESNFSSKVGLGEALGTRANLLIQGVLLAFQVANVSRLHLATHMLTQTPIRQSNLRALLQAIELLKAVQHTYFRKSALIAGQMLHIHRFLQTRLLQVLEPIAADLETQVDTGRKGGWKVDEAKLNACAMSTVLCDMLRGPNSRKRRAVAQVAWDMLPKKQIREGDVDEVNLQLRKLELLGSLQQLLAVATDCSFLLSSRALLPLFFAGMREDWKHARQLPHLMSAISDAGQVLAGACDAGAARPSAVGALTSYLLDVLQDEIIEPLCLQLETDLRIHIHSNEIAQMSKANPFKSTSPDGLSVLSLPPILLLGVVVNIKERVARYLDTTFYNLTTVTPHDWRTYEAMRTLAKDKYGISLVETYLPTGSVEQGIDVLEIMRNIHVFVTRYHYHLHTQVFVERPGDSKYVSTIGIEQVAHSIRTHGTGIMNTTVNYTYQFLARKLAILSQFLFDDHIKSRLVRDVNFFRKEKKALNNCYPYNRAHEFSSEIRRLGVDERGLSYLDKFRQLITEIGNALGYVRLMRSGGLHYVSAAVAYIPDIQSVDAACQASDTPAGEPAAAGGGGGVTSWGGFREFSVAVDGDGGVSEATRAAAYNLDAAINDLTLKFAAGTDFFQLLVQVFAPQLRAEEQRHLKNFYVIVPPLIINFVEHMLASKDKLIKGKRQIGGAFSDDGFALGLAYILRLLEQRADMDSLHWFESVNSRLREEGNALTKQRTEKKKATSEEEVQSLQLAISRLRALQVEHDLVYFTLRGATVFFKS